MNNRDEIRTFLLDSFTSGDLRGFLMERFKFDLDRIIPPGNPYKMQVARVIQHFEKQGQLKDLEKTLQLEMSCRTMSNPYKAQPFTPPSEMSGFKELIIHHISDLHFGGAHRDATDNKELKASRFEGLLAQSPAQHYLDMLKNNPNFRPHLLIVSGDLSTCGREGEIRQARYFLDQIINKKLLAKVDNLSLEHQIVVVPGNHDVDYSYIDQGADFSERFHTFYQCLDGLCNPFAKDRKHVLHPYLLIPQLQLLIYCFNSCILSGEHHPLADEVADYFRILGNERASISDIRAKLEALIRIDPGFIDQGQINRFRDLTGNWGQAMGIPSQLEYQGYIKIVVCHHHLNHFPGIEVKMFETLLNAGQLKQQLMADGFHILLHGHKHIPKVFYEEILSEYPGRGLYLVAAGSLSGWSPDGNSFNKLVLQFKRGEYPQVKVFKIPYENAQYSLKTEKEIASFFLM